MRQRYCTKVKTKSIGNFNISPLPSTHRSSTTIPNVCCAKPQSQDTSEQSQKQAEELYRAERPSKAERA